MLKAHMDLSRGDTLLATLTWHQVDESGQMLDIGFEFTDDIDEEMRKRVLEVCSMPLNISQNGVSVGKAFPGSSKHFENLPKHLERLGCRVRSYY
ncbi:MAG: hypothetical protein JXA36_00770 [Coriobacteriia bacterium]|nr:hypothetical protein [Coriobacteriia bacterium]